jgi:AmmeMemoRadiSam system protein A/AmmeMemoRadiSam system protein B
MGVKEGDRMALVSAVFVPHPPIILPEVGRGEEHTIQSTIDAYHQAALHIQRSHPETLIVVSPHAPFHPQSFTVSTALTESGDLRRFGAPQVAVTVETDREFIDALAHTGSPLRLTSMAGSLDHGTLIPLRFLLTDRFQPRIVRIGLSGTAREVHTALGQHLIETAERLHRRIAIVASGDLSHRLKADGPYGFDPAGPRFDAQVMRTLRHTDFDTLAHLDPTLCEAAGECGYRSLLVLGGALKSVPMVSEVLSYEGPFGVGYGVVTFTPHDPLVHWARSVITAHVTSTAVNENLGQHPALRHHRAGVFVSMHRHGQLRGCIGTLSPTRPNLTEEIRHNAISACSHDPRFYPVIAEELSDLEISVDVLGSPQPVHALGELDVKRYGVIVSSGGRRGVLLPDLEGVETVDEQVRIALRKAGIDADEAYTLERFEVVRHHDPL